LEARELDWYRLSLCESWHAYQHRKYANSQPVKKLLHGRTFLFGFEKWGIYALITKAIPARMQKIKIIVSSAPMRVSFLFSFENGELNKY
jgi:hypothetical protein